MTGSPGCAASTSRRSPGCSRCRSSGTARWSACSTSRPASRGSSATEEIGFLRTIAALLAGIVEKGRLTAEVEARLAQLTALDAARAELLSVVTHDLRTPLSVVRVYVDLLAEVATGATPLPDAPRPRRGGTAADDQLARLDRQVDSILVSVRGDGLTGLSRAPFDAVAAVDETVETLRLLLRPHPIRWERPAGAYTAIGDDTRFRQVLEQLLENESKYAPTGEGVSIGIWRVGEEIQVYVTDDGPGVPIEDWESVFEPFVRVEGRGRSRGSGIGLFAARRLMNAMGGRVFIEPNGYASSRFVVALPAGVGSRRESADHRRAQVAEVELRGRPAVGPDHGPGHPRGRVRDEERHERGDVLRLADPADRHDPVAERRGVARVLLEVARDLHEPGPDDEHPDPVRRQLHRERAAHRDDRALGCGVEDVAAPALRGEHRGHVDDHAVPRGGERRARGRGGEERRPRR